MVAALLMIAFGLEWIVPQRIGNGHPPVRRAFTSPAVIPDEKAERISLEQKQKALLNGAEGRMPIAEAMKAVAAKGSHAFDPVESAP
jgi:hypothetical protein